MAYTSKSPKAGRTYLSKVAPKKRRATRTKKAKIGSVTAKMSRKYEGNSEETVRPELYTEDEWGETISQITRGIKGPKKSHERLESVVERQSAEPSQDLWHSAAELPSLTKDDVKVLYGYESDSHEKSFIGSEDAQVVTLSQYANGDHANSIPDSSQTIEDSCSDEDPIIRLDEVVRAELRTDPVGTQHYPITISSSPNVLKSINQLPDLEVANTSDDVVFLGSVPMQVASSQKEEEVVVEVSVPEVPAPSVSASNLSAPSVSVPSISEVPDSQYPDEEELDLSLFDTLTTRQLKLQVKEWGLKPVRSRNEMLSLLKMTCRLLDEDMVKAAIRSFDTASDIITVSQKDSELVRSNVFAKIRELLAANMQQDILVYKPLDIEAVMDLLKREKIEYDQAMVKECLDTLGVCFTGN